MYRWSDISRDKFPALFCNIKPTGFSNRFKAIRTIDIARLFEQGFIVDIGTSPFSYSHKRGHYYNYITIAMQLNEKYHKTYTIVNMNNGHYSVKILRGLMRRVSGTSMISPIDCFHTTGFKKIVVDVTGMSFKHFKEISYDYVALCIRNMIKLNDGFMDLFGKADRILLTKDEEIEFGTEIISCRRHVFTPDVNSILNRRRYEDCSNDLSTVFAVFHEKAMIGNYLDVDKIGRPQPLLSPRFQLETHFKMWRVLKKWVKKKGETNVRTEPESIPIPIESKNEIPDNG